MRRESTERPSGVHTLFLLHTLFSRAGESGTSARQPDRRGVHFWGCLFWALPPFSPEAPDGGDSAQARVAATTADDGRGLILKAANANFTRTTVLLFLQLAVRV